MNYWKTQNKYKNCLIVDSFNIGWGVYLYYFIVFDNTHNMNNRLRFYVSSMPRRVNGNKEINYKLNGLEIIAEILMVKMWWLLLFYLGISYQTWALKCQSCQVKFYWKWYHFFATFKSIFNFYILFQRTFIKFKNVC